MALGPGLGNDEGMVQDLKPGRGESYPPNPCAPIAYADQQYPEWRKHIIKAKKTAWATVGTVVKLQVRQPLEFAARMV